MARVRKLLEALRNHPENVHFADFIRVVEAAGFTFLRQKGSHRIYQHRDWPKARLNLQPQGRMSKPYQVAQFLDLFDRYNLTI